MSIPGEKISAQPAFRLGIDLGGTKTEVVVLDHSLQPVYRKRVTTPSHDYEAILTLITSLVADAEKSLQVKPTIGIGTPGSISSHSGLLRNSNTVCMNGRAFLTDIEQRLDCAVKIQNDANCFTLSEALTGAGKDYAVVFGAIIGTGTGGGLVVNQQLLTGPNAITGEWGHNPLPWLTEIDGTPLCYCGKQACIETFVSGSGLARNFEKRNGVALSSEDIVLGARKGEKICKWAMSLYYDQLSRALAHLINILDPDTIVLGGGMSNIEEIYREIPRRLSDYIFSDSVETPILPALYGDASGVFGAAML
jgi:fructokinase